MTEVVLVTTYKRPEFLRVCLSKIREADPNIPIVVFPDRGTATDNNVWQAVEGFDAQIMWVGDHDYLGNTYNTMEAFRWACNEGSDFVYLVEDDVMVHQDFFSWHRSMHEEWDDLFASMGWLFNRYAPLTDDLGFQPWYYSIGTCFRVSMLQAVAYHASPLYYGDMQKYIEETFKDSKINSMVSISHYEQDGLIQRVLDSLKRQTVSPGMGKCTHLGCFGYNQGWNVRQEFFDGCESFEQRVQRIGEFLADPYWRLKYFDREVVEYEIGRRLPERVFVYDVTVDDWTSQYRSELPLRQLPRRLNSLDLPESAKVVLVS